MIQKSINKVKSIEIKNRKVVINSEEIGQTIIDRPKSVIIRSNISEINEFGDTKYITPKDTICQIKNVGDGKVVECGNDPKTNIIRLGNKK